LSSFFCRFPSPHLNDLVLLLIYKVCFLGEDPIWNDLRKKSGRINLFPGFLYLHMANTTRTWDQRRCSATSRIRRAFWYWFVWTYIALSPLRSPSILLFIDINWFIYYCLNIVVASIFIQWFECDIRAEFQLQSLIFQPSRSFFVEGGYDGENSI